MSALNDKNIRNALVNFLSSSSDKPKSIIEELRVHNGNAIADVVLVNELLHCFEIKGEGDNINRINIQGKYYDLVFPRITLVVTENHLNRALDMAPAHWGIIHVRESDGSISFLSKRKSKINRNIDKKKSTLTLWKSEMVEIASPLIEKPERKTRDSLASIISKSLCLKNLNLEISNKIHGRTITTNTL